MNMANCLRWQKYPWIYARVARHLDHLSHLPRPHHQSHTSQVFHGPRPLSLSLTHTLVLALLLYQVFCWIVMFDIPLGPMHNGSLQLLVMTEFIRMISALESINMADCLRWWLWTVPLAFWINVVCDESCHKLICQRLSLSNLLCKKLGGWRWESTPTTKSYLWMKLLAGSVILCEPINFSPHS